MIHLKITLIHVTNSNIFTFDISNKFHNLSSNVRYTKHSATIFFIKFIASVKYLESLLSLVLYLNTKVSFYAFFKRWLPLSKLSFNFFLIKPFHLIFIYGP